MVQKTAKSLYASIITTDNDDDYTDNYVLLLK